MEKTLSTMALENTGNTIKGKVITRDLLTLTTNHLSIMKEATEGPSKKITNHLVPLESFILGITSTRTTTTRRVQILKSILTGTLMKISARIITITVEMDSAATMREGIIMKGKTILGRLSMEPPTTEIHSTTIPTLFQHPSMGNMSDCDMIWIWI